MQLAASPDGQWLAAFDGRELTLWPAAGGPAAARAPLAEPDGELVFVGPPDAIVCVARGRVALYAVPELTRAAELELPADMRVLATTGPRVVVGRRDEGRVHVVRESGRALAAIALELGAPLDIATGLERDHVLFGLPRRLEVWDATLGRPARRLALQLPPPPRRVGAAAGHIWAFQPGGEDVYVYRLSDGRPFHHRVGARIDDVVAHPASPLVVLVTPGGLVRLSCFAHSLALIDGAPAEPGAALALAVAGEEVALAGLGGDGVPWRLVLGGRARAAAAPDSTAGESEPGATAAAESDPALTALSTGAPSFARGPSFAARAPSGPAPAPSFAARAPSGPAPAPSGPAPAPPFTGRAPSFAARAPSGPAPAPSFTARAPSAPPPAAPAPAPAPSFAARAPSGAMTAPTLTAAEKLRAMRSGPAEPGPAAQPAPGTWRDALAAWADDLARGDGAALPDPPDDSEIAALADQLALGAAARRALVALYAHYLVGRPAVPLAQLARAAGDWTESLGRGELAALALVRRARGAIALRAGASAWLDGAPPCAVRIVGSSLGAALPPGAYQVLHDGRDDDELEAELARALGRIALVEGRLGRALLEACLAGATAVTFAPPAAPPQPWPAAARLVVVVGPAAPAWTAALSPLPAR
jgi:hypothetical protein